MPGLVQLRDKFKGRLEIVGVHVGNGTDADVAKIVKKQKLPYPVVRANDLAHFKDYGFKSLPSIVVVDAKGVVRFVGKAHEAEKFAAGLLTGSSK